MKNYLLLKFIIVIFKLVRKTSYDEVKTILKERDSNTYEDVIHLDNKKIERSGKSDIAFEIDVHSFVVFNLRIFVFDKIFRKFRL